MNHTPAYFRIHKKAGPHYRTASIEVVNARVTATTPALAFMIGWEFSKVNVRVRENDFRITTLHNKTTRPDSFITEKPSVEARKAAKRG